MKYRELEYIRDNYSKISKAKLNQALIDLERKTELDQLEQQVLDIIKSILGDE
jgi:hypothetical protein